MQKPLKTVPELKMNKTEQRFEKDYLKPRFWAGDVLAYHFEGVTLKLANNTRYTPDFFVVHADHFEIIEVKGFWRDDARVKIKVAAHQYPYFKFKAVQWKDKQWKFEEI